MNDVYDYLDFLEEPDEKELLELERTLQPDKLKLETLDNITLEIDDEEIDIAIDFTRTENGYKKIVDKSATNKHTNISLSNIVENKHILYNLQEHGIYNTDDILQRTRREIESFKFIGKSGAHKIGYKLHINNLLFADESFCKCSKCNAEFIYSGSNKNIELCPVCQPLSDTPLGTSYYIYNSTKSKVNLSILLNYIDSYVYDTETEEIMIKPSSNALNALTAYQNVIEEYSTMQNDYFKWSLDIALNFIREETEEGKEKLKQNFWFNFINLRTNVMCNYLQFVKNHKNFNADYISYLVSELISTICHPYYNHFNKQLTELLSDSDYQIMYTVYSKKFSFIHDYTMLLTSPECTLLAKEVLQSIKQKLRIEIGMDGFKNILNSCAKKISADLLTQNNWLELLSLLQRNGCQPFQKEYNQLVALKEIGVLNFVKEFDCADKIKKSIISELGLINSDAQYMAECIGILFKIK